MSEDCAWEWVENLVAEAYGEELHIRPRRLGSVMLVIAPCARA